MCAARMEDVASNWETVVRMVKSLPLNITVQPKVIAWSRPGDGCFKLNVDGGSNGNPDPSGGGGILRDARGHAREGKNSRIMDFDRDDIGIGRLQGLLRTDYLEMLYLRR
ncbi:hypothetical protein QYF36_005904 [Acer negundo]|nr:hypothetical protein QYF36_005904 [Acer negundo]